MVVSFLAFGCCFRLVGLGRRISEVLAGVLGLRVLSCVVHC